MNENHREPPATPPPGAPEGVVVPFAPRRRGPTPDQAAAPPGEGGAATRCVACGAPNPAVFEPLSEPCDCEHCRSPTSPWPDDPWEPW